MSICADGHSCVKNWFLRVSSITGIVSCDLVCNLVFCVKFYGVMMVGEECKCF